MKPAWVDFAPVGDSGAFRKALGRQRDRQVTLVSWSGMLRSPGHAFYDRLQAELVTAGFDGFVGGLWSVTTALGVTPCPAEESVYADLSGDRLHRTRRVRLAVRLGRKLDELGFDVTLPWRETA